METSNVKDSARNFTVDELVVNLEGQAYNIDRGSVVDAFFRAPLGDFAGKHQRFFMKIEHDMKSTIAVFSEMVPIERESVDERSAERIAGIFRTLGFEILDSRIHHKK